MIKSLFTSIAVMNRNIKRGQIAAGAAWGLLLALVPLGNFFWIVLLFVSLFLRHSHVAAILVLVAGKLLAPLVAPPLDGLGWAVLHIEALQPFFTALYNMPLAPLTGFNNTLVAGGLVGGAILWPLSFLLVFGLVTFCRKVISPAFRGSKRRAGTTVPATSAKGAATGTTVPATSAAGAATSATGAATEADAGETVAADAAAVSKLAARLEADLASERNAGAGSGRGPGEGA